MVPRTHGTNQPDLGANVERLALLLAAVRRTIVPRDGFHLVFQREFPFFEGDFFELFVIGEVVLLGELVEAIIQLVVAFGELPVVLVASQQQVLHFLRFRCAHGGTLLSNRGPSGDSMRTLTLLKLKCKTRNAHPPSSSSRHRISASSTGFE